MTVFWWKNAQNTAFSDKHGSKTLVNMAKIIFVTACKHIPK